jgi:hypothetical protein
MGIAWFSGLTCAVSLIEHLARFPGGRFEPVPGVGWVFAQYMLPALLISALCARVVERFAFAGLGPHDGDD